MGPLMVNPEWQQLGACNAIVTAALTDYQVDDYVSPLSVKSVVSGIARYRVERHERSITARDLLVVSAGASYDMRVAATDPAQTLCVFFERGFVEAASAALRDDLEDLTAVDDGAVTAGAFPDYVLPKSDRVADLLDRALRRATTAHASGDAYVDVAADENWLYEMAAALALVRNEQWQELARIDKAKASTRLELRRRLGIARDFMASCYHLEDLTVSAIAAQAFLAPHYFHRVHKRFFGTTPMTSLREIRLLHARRLLATQDLTLTEVCSRVGLRSIGSFAAAFHRRFGAPPAAFRRASAPAAEKSVLKKR